MMVPTATQWVTDGQLMKGIVSHVGDAVDHEFPPLELTSTTGVAVLPLAEIDDPTKTQRLVDGQSIPMGTFGTRRRSVGPAGPAVGGVDVVRSALVSALLGVAS